MFASNNCLGDDFDSIIKIRHEEHAFQPYLASHHPINQGKSTGMMSASVPMLTFGYLK